MDPADSFNASRGSANQSSFPSHTAHQDAPVHPHRNHSIHASNPDYHTQQHMQHSMSSSVGQFQPYRSSPPNTMPQQQQQHPEMLRASPYFAPNTRHTVPSSGYTNSHPPHTLSSHGDNHHQGNRIILPPLRQPNAMQTAALGVNMNNYARNSDNFVKDASVSAVTNSSAPIHEVKVSGAQHENSNINSAASTFHQKSLNQPIAQSIVGRATGAPSFATYDPPQTSQMSTFPLPETAPEPLLSLTFKTKKPKLHHHPDLPFLVTHWVDHYAAESSDKMLQGDKETKKEDALIRLRHAAKEMAWAFETLGAFGDSCVRPISSFDESVSYRSTTYTDLIRRYAPMLCNVFSSNLSSSADPNMSQVTLLDSLVTAGSSASNEACRSVLETIMPWSLLEASYEGTVPTNSAGTSTSNLNKQSNDINTGRRVGESTSDPSDESLHLLFPTNESSGSTLNNPVLMGGALTNNARQTADGFSTCGKLSMTLGSNFETVTKNAAEASRKYLYARMQVSEQITEYQKTRMAMQLAIGKVTTAGSTLESVEARSQSIDQSDANSDVDQHRVIAQLQRRLGEMQLKISTAKKEAADAKNASDKAYQELSSIHGRYRDPYQASDKGLFSIPHVGERRLSSMTNMKSGLITRTHMNKNVVLPGVVLQQYQGKRQPSDITHKQLLFLKSRLSHAVTINCHLVYPVYCLKFDKSGKYFITGSDDQLVKLFYLGAGPKLGQRPAGKRFSYGANMRGAVLVCTLRGHAGVITDIDVSVDNALLATASVDGDVRIWGLRDGCPVAILRGHKDGANMVSWSLLTPYRLVTCGDDGLARMWDVRKAALKRYVDMVGKRTDYIQPNQPDLDEVNDEGNCLESQELLPPVPMPQPNNVGVDANHGIGPESNDVVVPPLPPGAEGEDLIGNSVNVANANHNGGNIGEFVANDAIDEGVEVIARMQHGEIIRENQQGVGTRARRKAVKVMCIARCPIGGHFATGSDDGLGRIWADSDDIRVENLDRTSIDSKESASPAFTSISKMFTREVVSARHRSIIGPASAPSKERLLAILSGHTNAITDMIYSSAGDRILTASMKDGIVRVWSWGKETPIFIDGRSSAANDSDLPNNNAFDSKFSNISQLLIRLTPVNQGEKQEAQSSKRKGLPSATNNSSSVHCDGVIWTCDDTKIVTSQSSPTKTTELEIIPGSHIIYVWDSHSGRCLLGIHGAHTALCSTLVAHPFLPSIVVAAGADGIVNVWDLDRGESFCSHKNSLLHGPMENAASRGKPCSYLEGQFSPDGSYLILSDEAGRVSIFDTMSNQDSFVAPSWMTEQYFANDYYELFYDSNGYCIERGSERPPHLAPKGVRCSHEGVSITEDVRDVFDRLSGPHPLSADIVRWGRNDIRIQNHKVHMESGILSRNIRKKATTLVESPGLLVGCRTTAIITPDGQLIRQNLDDKSSATRFGAPTTSGRAASSTESGRGLSSRYTWVDFNDLADEEDDQYEDTDDEEYRGEGRMLSNGHNDHDLSDVEDESPVRVNRARQRSHTQRSSSGRRNRRDSGAAFDSQDQAQPTRSSTRRAQRRSIAEESESEDEFFEELVSTHTKPSGQFAKDWLSADHFFKMPRGTTVNRKWVTRTTSQGNNGSKAYCPQVGDSIVYIPRAHYDTLQSHPTGDYTAPWKSWPQLQPWPVVRCKVVHARYRFPYEMYFSSRGRRTNGGLKDVAVILTLEITGVPHNCDNRLFPWPAPIFDSPVSTRTRSHDSTFEVTMFDSGQADFIIPEYLYISRIKGLEKAIEQNDEQVAGLVVNIKFPPGDADDPGFGTEDPPYISYEANLVDLSEPEDEDYHFQGSGYNSIVLHWADADSYQETLKVCAWDVEVVGLPVPKAPEMSAETRSAVNAALKQVMNYDPQIIEWFDLLPDTRIYSDYLTMIEAPMFLSRIRLRMQNNYYTNKDSVVSDIELIKENCYKYNEDNNDFYTLACEMLEKFKSLVADIPDDPLVDDSNESDRETILRRGAGVARTSNISSNSALRSPNRMRRGLSQQQSSLANLPQPDGYARALRRSTRSLGGNVSAAVGGYAQGLHGSLGQQQNRASSRSTRRSQSDANNQDYNHGIRRSTRATERTRYTEETSEQEIDSDVESEEIQSTRRSRRNLPPNHSQLEDHSTRRSERTRTKYNFEEADDNQDAHRRQTRVTRRQAHTSNENIRERPHRSRASLEMDLSPSPRKRPNRRSTAARKNAEISSDDEDSDEYSSFSAEDVDDHEESHVTKKEKVSSRVGANSSSPSSRKSPSIKQSSQARSSSRQRGKISYVEIDSDEEEYNNDEFSDMDDDIPKRKRSRSQRGSFTPDSDRDSFQKKRALGSPSRKSRGKNDAHYPSLSQWPHISLRKMLNVGLAVLRILREYDSEGLFALPVAEAYPDMAEDYLAVINEPMDFRTIEELRLHQYRHIHELQDDLALTFKNCCVFNAEGSEFYNNAIQIWQNLNEIFKEACEENHVSLPPRFS